MKRLAILLVVVLAIIAVTAIVLVIPGGDDAADETRSRVERELSRGYHCPGQPPPPTTCTPRDEGFDCDVGGTDVRVDDPDHLEISQIC